MTHSLRRRLGMVVLLAVVVVGGAAGGLGPAVVRAQEAGGSLDGLAADVHSVLLLPEDDGYRVVETVRLINPGQVTSSVAVLPVFQGAQGVELLAGFEGAVTATTPVAVQATVAIPPGGERTFMLAYRLPAQDPPASLVRAIAHPTNRLVLMVPPDAPFELLAEGLVPQGEGRFAERAVRVYAAEAVAPVMEWVLGLAPAGPPPWQDAAVPVIDHARSYQGAWRPVALGFGVMTVWALALRAGESRRRRGLRLPAVEAWMEDVALISDRERERLAGEILTAAVELERARRGGRIDERTYRAEREALLVAWKHLHLGEEGAP